LFQNLWPKYCKFIREIPTNPLGQGWLTCGALHPFDDNKVSQSYSLILVILFFLDALSSYAMFLSDQSGFTVVKNISMVFLTVGL